jgi:alkanesulfonate monooxygenase SsuD/methylene tetrahydromethanopterin reductase-like flavin-dependent oxidoreductase (luciferase family)
MTFRPTRAPIGRLVRLGVVLDTRNGPDRLQEIARMCDGAGLDALWVWEHPNEEEEPPRGMEAWDAIGTATRATSRVHVGVVADVGMREAPALALMAQAANEESGGRFELGLAAGGSRPKEFERYAIAMRTLMTLPTDPAISVGALVPSHVTIAARIADDLMVRARAAVDLREFVALARVACDHAGRDPTSLGVALEVPVSIGRTRAEAEARAEAEPLFRVVGSPARIGVFGTLEECQARVLELAHTGVTELRCVPPNSDDIHDVIAQLTAIAVGTMDILTPGAPRSKAPDPPPSWGGRRKIP